MNQKNQKRLHWYFPLLVWAGSVIMGSLGVGFIKELHSEEFQFKSLINQSFFIFIFISIISLPALILSYILFYVVGKKISKSWLIRIISTIPVLFISIAFLFVGKLKDGTNENDISILIFLFFLIPPIIIAALIHPFKKTIQ